MERVKRRALTTDERRIPSQLVSRGLASATPSRNVTLSYRPMPVLPLSLFLSAVSVPPGPSIPPRLCFFRFPSAFRAARTRECNKRRGVFIRAVKWHSVSYCRGTSVLVFEA